MATRITDLRHGEGAYATLDDRMLVLDFQAGDPEAFVAIHARYGGLVRHVCSRYLPNTADADEAFQETMIRVFQGLYRFNGQFALQPWIARIATNISLDILRGRARRPAMDERSLEEHDREDPGERPDEAVERLVQRDLILNVLADMPDTHRRALVLREMEGLSHREIGEELEITPAQAKALIHRAKGTFRRRWLQGIADRSGVMAFALAPAMWAMRAIGGMRRVVDRVAQATITTDVVSNAASSSTVAPATTFTAERLVAAATVTVLIAGGVTVGAVTLRHRSMDKADRQPAAVAAPAPSPPVAPAVEPQRREAKAKHDGRAEAPADASPVTEVVPTAPPTPPTSPSPPSETGTPSPPVSPVPPPAPAWSGAFSWSMFEGGAELSQVDSRVDGSAQKGFLFSQATTGSLTAADGTAYGLYLEYWGSANGADGSSSAWIFVDTPVGRYRYDGSLSLGAVTLADDGTWTYVFEGSYALTDAPEDTGDLVMPHDGAATLVLSLWSDGTSLYEASLSLDEGA